MTEGHDYRHGTHLHFGHTDAFPRTADITVCMAHSEDPEALEVKFDYIILPAYMTEEFKFADERDVRMAAGKDGEIAVFLEAGVERFLKNYMLVYRG